MRVCVEEAVARVLSGEVVAVPTDTVYGLVALPDHKEVMEALYVLKGRPRDKPCLLLGDSPEQLMPLAVDLPHTFSALAEAFWPGALTLVVPARKGVARHARAGRASVGMRMPDCDVLREVLRCCGSLAAPSANKSGKTPALSAEEVERAFGIGMPVLEGGGVLRGVASTILIAEGDRWVCRRQGAVNLAAVTSVLGEGLLEPPARLLNGARVAEGAES